MPSCWAKSAGEERVGESREAETRAGARSFRNLSVVAIGDSAAGAYCARLFAGLGAQTTRVADTPLPGDLFYSSVVPAVSIEGDELTDLLSGADVVIQASAVDPIADRLSPSDASQIVVHLSPFASTGPYATWRSTDLVDAAIAGHLRLSGDPEREPLQGVPDMVHHAAGVMAFVSAMAALIARERGAGGQVVEVTHHEVIVALHQFTLCRHTHNGAVLLSTMLDRDDIGSIWDLMMNPELLDSELIPWMLTQQRDEVVELFQALRLPCAPISSIAELLVDPHLDARDFWSTTAGETVVLPGQPFHLSDHDWSNSPEPTRGELADTSQADETVNLATESVDLGDGPLTGLRILDLTRVWAGPLAARLLADLGAEVLMVEVPWTRTPREVAESYVSSTRFFPDDDGGARPWNRSAFHNKYANNKLSTVIELDKPEGRQLLADLVPTADVVIENYSPRVMPGFGFDQDTLHEINPDLIYVTMPGYGREGPYTDWVAYGPTIDGHVGHTTLTGYRGEGPWKCGIAWPDPIGGMHAAAATLVALLDRLVEPESGGQSVEVAQVESAINMIGQHVAETQLSGQRPRMGNRRPGRAPQGVYPCAGPDRWIAISVIDDRSWQGLCAVLQMDDLASLAPEEREQRHDELDERIAAFTASADGAELARQLQDTGVPAGELLDAPQIMADPQLAAVDFFVELDHADAGAHLWPRFPGRLFGTPATLRRPAALMGEHNRYAVCDLAGRDEDAYEALVESGVVRIDPPV